MTVMTPNSRLEARVSFELKQLFQRAAELEGITLTDFIINSARIMAQTTIERYEILRLNREDSIAFVTALNNPPEPNEALKAAFQRHG